MSKDHEQQRKELWVGVYIAYVRADNSTDQDGASRWADTALKRFDERFPKPPREGFGDFLNQIIEKKDGGDAFALSPLPPHFSPPIL